MSLTPIDLDVCLLIAGVSQVVSSLVQLSLLLPSCGPLGSCMLTAVKRVIIGRPGLSLTYPYLALLSLT